MHVSEPVAQIQLYYFAQDEQEQDERPKALLLFSPMILQDEAMINRT